jgi:hypothetical protein
MLFFVVVGLAVAMSSRLDALGAVRSLPRAASVDVGEGSSASRSTEDDSVAGYVSAAVAAENRMKRRLLRRPYLLGDFPFGHFLFCFQSFLRVLGCVGASNHFYFSVRCS